MKQKDSEQIISDAIASGVISERDIKVLQKRRFDSFPKEVYDGEVSLTDEQTNKALTWLFNQYKTANGKVRKNNPFGCREIEVLENSPIMGFAGFYPQYYGSELIYLYPIYTVYAAGVCSFQYYVRGGKVEIIS